MSTSVTLNAVTYTIPAQGEGNWGTNVSSYLIALSTGVLQKAGGTFTLTADVDFGATYGLKSVYYKSRNTPSTAGIVRLGNNESVGWRNAANSANLELKVNASNLLEYNGSLIGILAAALTASRALVSDGSGNVSVSSVTSTQLAYLASATGTTGTTSTNLVFSTSPTFITPTLGVASATSINKVAITAPATGSTLTIADGKTVTLSKTMTLTSADDTSTLTLAAGAQTVGGTSSGDIVTLGGTQTLTAKTLTAPIIDQANFTQGASATTPAAGKSAVYVNSGDAKLHVVDSSGNDVAVGSGSSGRNYLGDWFDSAKDIGTVTNSLTDVVDTSDRTANKTTWGASDTSLLTIARSASSPLRQSYSYAITEAGSSSGAFVESPLFTLDSLDLGKPVTVSFDVSGNSTSDYYQVYICRYDSNDVLKERVPIAGTASATSPYSARLPVGTTNFQGFFVASSTSTDQYSLRIVSNNNSADSLKIDSLYVGPQSVVQGAAVTDWVSCSPTISGFAVSASTAFMRRVGDSMEIMYSGTISSVSSGIAISPPSGYTVDTAKISQTSNHRAVVGTAWARDVGTNYRTGVMTVPSGATYALADTESTTGNWAATVPFTWANNDIIAFHVKFPIANWSSNVTMANRAVEEYAYNSATADSDDTTSFAYGAAGVAFGSYTAARSKRIRFTTPILATDRLHLEVYDDTNYMWSSPSETRSGSLVYQNQNGVTYGMYLTGVNATDVDVSFGTYAKPASTTYGGVGSAWSSLASKKWRVRKVSGGASVGYPIASENVIVPHKALATSTTTYTSNSFESGTYTATLTNVSNVSSSTFRNARYIRVGNVVTVFVTFSIATTAAAPTTTQFYLSLPIASAFTAGYDCLGTGTRYKGSGAFDPIYIETDSAGDRAYCYFYSSSTTAADTAMTFSYVVM